MVGFWRAHTHNRLIKKGKKVKMGKVDGERDGGTEKRRKFGAD